MEGDLLLGPAVPYSLEAEVTGQSWRETGRGGSRVLGGPQ